MSNSSLVLARNFCTLPPLRVNGDEVRRAAPDLGVVTFTGEGDDTALLCSKLPSNLRGDADAALVSSCTWSHQSINQSTQF